MLLRGNCGIIYQLSCYAQPVLCSRFLHYPADTISTFSFIITCISWICIAVIMMEWFQLQEFNKISMNVEEVHNGA